MRNVFLVAALVTVWLLPVLPSAAAEIELRDRILAVVDEDPIYLSDVERTLVLGLYPANDQETDRQRRRRVLDGLIVERLRLHEVDRFRLAPLPPEAVEPLFEGLRDGFADPEAFAAALLTCQLDEQSLRRILLGRVKVLQYIEERLRPRVFVDLDDIRAYYDGELTEELARQGLEPQPIEEVREIIRGVLRELRLNELIGTWTEELRQGADIEDFFERTLGEELPAASSPSSG